MERLSWISSVTAATDAQTTRRAEPVSRLPSPPAALRTVPGGLPVAGCPAGEDASPPSVASVS
eukprot:scaffold10698_cov112-Isochrysis_galbana.AAC.1